MAQARTFGFATFAVVLSMLTGCHKDRGASLEGKNVDDLAVSLRMGKVESRAQAALELSKRGMTAAKAVPELIEALRSDDAALRQNAALALGKIGPPATSAVESLIIALADTEWTVRRNAVIALGEIGDPNAISAIEGLLRDPDSLVRKAAEQSLHRLRSK